MVVVGLGTMDSRTVVLVAVLGALGNIMSGLSIYSAPLIPSIPFGAVSISLALDLSHLSTFIGALIGGPMTGTLTGFISGALAAYQFGFAQGNIVTGIALPIGKALTGLVAGLLMRRRGLLRREGKPLLLVPITVLAYIPESLYTAFIFIVLFPAIYGLPLSVVYLLTAQILVKAFFEMLVLGGAIAALLSNRAFRNFAVSIASGHGESPQETLQRAL
jgi:hypothetical protein